jgi:hypothetical protein
MASWKTSLGATALGALVGTAIGLLAFSFLNGRQFPYMGSALFFLTPVAAGFSVSMIARKADIAVAAVLLSVVCSLALLIALGKEGVLCAILAFPIMIAGLALGVGIGVLARKLLLSRAGKQNATTGILLLAAPMIVLAGERAERPMLQGARIEVIQSAVEVTRQPERVWPQILSIDSIQASKPFLMYVGLPIPQRCMMQGRGIGAKRTCFFNVGYIEETVTVWNPPYGLGFSIDRTHMPGRHWLRFENAEYRLEPQGQNTLLTRTTTISSHLHPSWYWRVFERLGVESEHNYILRDVAIKAGH